MCRKKTVATYCPDDLAEMHPQPVLIMLHNSQVTSIALASIAGEYEDLGPIGRHVLLCTGKGDPVLEYFHVSGI